MKLNISDGIKWIRRDSAIIVLNIINTHLSLFVSARCFLLFFIVGRLGEVFVFIFLVFFRQSSGDYMDSHLIFTVIICIYFYPFDIFICNLRWMLLFEVHTLDVIDPF